MAGRDETNGLLILVLGLALALPIFAALVGPSQYHRLTRSREQAAMVGRVGPEPLRELTLREDELLATFGRLEGLGPGAVRIPIDLAIELQADDPLPPPPPRD